MATIEGPGIVTSNLVFYYDTKNIKSYDGRPTTNIASTNFTNYNNVPSNVTTVLTATNEFYKDAIVYKQTLTALDATGVSYLTNANNPGIGLFHGGGGGLANRYTGHSIFFKPACAMNSLPIFTNYSNIVGWQSNGLYDDMGDGWFRAKVIWYDTVTRSDNKYWAINPLSATIGVPLTIYWAGPFKEDLNSQYISQYTVGTRSNTNALFSLVQNPVSKVTIDLSAASFDSNCDIIFNGVDDIIYLGTGNTFFPLYNFTLEVWIKSPNMAPGMSSGGIFCLTYGLANQILSDGSLYFGLYNTINSTTYGLNSTGVNLFSNTWRHIVCTNDGIKSTIYIDGILNISGSALWSGTTAWPTDSVVLGRDNNNTIYYYLGNMSLPKIYNKCLTSTEVLQNYNATKNKFT